jgi:hypothetical protein
MNMSEELQVFRGDRPVEEVEKAPKAPSKPTAAKPPLTPKNELPAGEPIGEFADAAATPPAPLTNLMPEIEPGPMKVETEPEPPYNFDIDPDSLWAMPEAMQERLSNLTVTVAVTHQLLDDQERDSARIAKALRALSG